MQIGQQKQEYLKTLSGVYCNEKVEKNCVFKTLSSVSERSIDQLNDCFKCRNKKGKTAEKRLILLSPSDTHTLVYSTRILLNHLHTNSKKECFDTQT